MKAKQNTRISDGVRAAGNNGKPAKAADTKAAERILALNERRATPPRYKLLEGKNGAVAYRAADGDDAECNIRMHSVYGFKNRRAVSMLTEQLLLLWEADVERHDAARMNQAIAMLDELAPTDGPEGMLAAQMVAVHVTAMQCFSRANLEGQTFAGRELNLKQGVKLSRTFSQQLQALDKHRRNGQQQVTVKHVHVNEGGQAIVGNVTTGKGA